MEPTVPVNAFEVSTALAGVATVAVAVVAGATVAAAGFAAAGAAAGVWAMAETQARTTPINVKTKRFIISSPYQLPVDRNPFYIFLVLCSLFDLTPVFFAALCFLSLTTGLSVAEGAIVLSAAAAPPVAGPDGGVAGASAARTGTALIKKIPKVPAINAQPICFFICHILLSSDQRTPAGIRRTLNQN
jgi:hypothetical protein